MRLLPLSHLLAGASAVALLIGVSPSIAQEPVAPSPATVQCGASCQVRVTMAPASGRRAGSSPWLEAYTTLHFDLRNTSPVSPPMFINLEMAGENPTFYVRAVNANGNVLARSEGFNELVGGVPRPMDPVRILAPGESLEFYQDIKGFLAIGGVHRFELMRGGNVVATLPFNIDEYLSAERRMFRNGQLHKMISTVPLHPNGAGLVGDWRDRDGQRSLTLSRNGWTLIGTLRIGGIGARRLELHSGPSEAEYMGRISDETGQTELGRVRVTVLSDGTLKAESLTPQATGQALTGLSDREVNWVLMRPAAVPSPPPPTAPPPPPPPVVAEPTPTPPSPAEPVGQWTAAAYQPWVGTWWFGGEYIVIGSGDGELTAEWFDASASRTKKANLQFDLGRSNPQRLVGLSTEVSRPGISDLELTIAADKQSILMFGGHPQFPFGGQLRRVAAMGDRPTLPSAPAVINQLSAAWDTPMGRLQFSAAGTGELRGQVTGQPRGLALTRGANGRPIDSNVDAIDMYFETVEEFGASTGQVRVIPGADGRTVTILRLEGEAVFGRPVMTARKTGSSSAPQPLPPPDIPSPPGDNPAPGTGAGPTQPPAPTTPPTDQPAPEPVPPSLPEPDPLPPGDSAPTPSEPVPPTPVPVPPTPRPQPPEPQPTPPVVQPTPPQPAPPQGGAGSVPGSGGYQGISQTWDVQFEGARVERGAEVHVFVSVKNRSTSDQYITPGTFIPNLGNQDGEVITSRAVYRASGDNPTEFRPTVPVNEAVRVRFIFRPEAGSAQPRTFTLESFGHRKLTFDVSGLRVSSLAQ